MGIIESSSHDNHVQFRKVVPCGLSIISHDAEIGGQTGRNDLKEKGDNKYTTCIIVYM